VDEGYEHWLLKFDGVSNNRDKELADPQGFGRIEYAYHLMATAAGIDMSECRLHHEGGRSHFMTRRFDRDGRGRKLHMQSLGAMQHFDFNDPASYSYEQAALTIRDLGLGMDVVEQQVRRAIFNVVARNQDDHVKNISFLMDRSGTWRLSPAYDVAYSYNPSGAWTRDHQMSLAGKRNDFTHDDLMAFASNVGVKAVRAKRAIEEVAEAVDRWRALAEEAGVDPSDMSRIEKTFRMTLRGR
jgi:serine/threonine-protein kinase HipA